MLLRTLSGDDELNSLCMAAMNSVANTMEIEGYLDKSQRDEFLKNHICQIASSDGGFKTWFEGIFGKQQQPQTRTICSRAEIREGK